MLLHGGSGSADLLTCGHMFLQRLREPARTPVVEQADGGGVLGQEPAPLVERPVRADAQGTPFVGGGDEPEQQLGAGVVEWCEADLVDDDQVVAEQGVDEAADGVVGQAAVEGLDEVGGGEVADLVACCDGGDAERDQAVTGLAASLRILCCLTSGNRQPPPAALSWQRRSTVRSHGQRI
jgi:hypothetical protein